MKHPFPAVWRSLSVGLLTAICASAVPIACPISGSFATLLATNAEGGCFVADKLFSEFTYQSSGTDPLPDNLLDYTTVANAPFATGFEFSGAILALQNGSMEINLGWLVTGPNIRSLHLGFTSSRFGNATATVDETYCKGGPVAGCAPGDTGELNVFRSQSLGVQLADEALFSPVGVLGIAKTITVTSSGLSGFANISEITQTVDQLPEPSTTVAVASGILALWLVRGRWKSGKSRESEV